MRTPKIHMIDPSKLIPYDKNPRDNSEAIEVVAKSIKKYGFNQPLLIDNKLRICAGHTRREAALLLGLEEIPCLKKTMTEKEFVEYNLADNKTGEIATWDDDLLQEILLEMSDGGQNLDAFDIPGFTDEDMNNLFSEDQSQDSPSDSKRTSNESTKMVFNCTAKQAMEIDSKLDGIIRENRLDNQVEALLYALKNFKGNPKIKRVIRS